MSAADEEVSTWLHGLKAGDPRALEQVWNDYFDKLMRLIRGRLAVPLKMADEEDVALSALNSFYDGVRAGRFPQLDDRDDLWKILVTIACRKTSAYRDRILALKRGGGQVRGESAFDARDHSDCAPGIAQVLGREPTPEVAAALADSLQALFAALPDAELQGIATRKLEGHTNEEIAVELGCTTRTIERKLERIRASWAAFGAGSES